MLHEPGFWVLILSPALAVLGVVIQNKYEQGYWLGQWSFERARRAA